MLKTDTSILRGASGHRIQTLGLARLKARSAGTVVILDCHVTPIGPDILGLNGIKQLKVNLSDICTVSTDKKLSELIQRVASNEGGLRIDPVHLVCNSEPKFFRARPLAYGLRDAVQQNLSKLVDDDILEKVQYSEWATPIVVVMKANGSVRICGDYRVTVNGQLQQTACTTSEPEDIFAGLAGSTTFSKVDLTNAFLQIPLDESSRVLTTINTPFGLYRYRYLPFGLSVSPGVFQATIDSIRHGLNGVVAYQDDIIVFGKTLEEHDKNLTSLLEKLDKVNVKINADKNKSLFRQSTLPYLGYRLSAQGVTPDPDRVRAIQKTPTPTDHAQLRSALGLLQYYSRFIRNFASLAAPLFKVQCMEKFDWTPEKETAFRTLIDKITSAPVLRCFPFSEPVIVITDASESGIGAMLEQEDNLSYASLRS